MFPLLYGGSLCVIGGLALVVVAWIARAGRRKHVAEIEALILRFAALGTEHTTEVNGWRERYKRVATRCKDLERELTEIRLGTATAGYTFDQVPAPAVTPPKYTLPKCPIVLRGIKAERAK